MIRSQLLTKVAKRSVLFWINVLEEAKDRW